MITLHIPLQIPSQNETGKGLTWRTRAAAIKRLRMQWKSFVWHEMLVMYCAIASGPRKIHIIAYRKRRCMDIANLIGGAKACVDGMVDAGLLMDDRDSMAQITYDQRLASESPTGKAMTILQVSDISSRGAAAWSEYPTIAQHPEGIRLVRHKNGTAIVYGSIICAKSYFVECINIPERKEHFRAWIEKALAEEATS